MSMELLKEMVDEHNEAIEARQDERRYASVLDQKAQAEEEAAESRRLHAAYVKAVAAGDEKAAWAACQKLQPNPDKPWTLQLVRDDIARYGQYDSHLESVRHKLESTRASRVLAELVAEHRKWLDTTIAEGEAARRKLPYLGFESFTAIGIDAADDKDELLAEDREACAKLRQAVIDRCPWLQPIDTVEVVKTRKTKGASHE